MTDVTEMIKTDSWPEAWKLEGHRLSDPTPLLGVLYLTEEGNVNRLVRKIWKRYIKHLWDGRICTEQVGTLFGQGFIHDNLDIK